MFWLTWTFRSCYMDEHTGPYVSLNPHARGRDERDRAGSSLAVES